MFLNMILSVRHAEAERKRREEAEHKAKLDEIAEKQRQRERELEEKERLRKEALLGRSGDGPTRPSDLLGGARPVAPGTAAPAAATVAAPALAPSPGKYVPRFKREQPDNAGPARPAEPDRWSSSLPDDRGSQPRDSWRSSDDRRSAFGTGRSSSRASWSSSRVPR